MSSRRCWVFVLGDFGRSPRMQYHTHALLQKGFQVMVIGSPGSQPLPAIVGHPEFTFQPILKAPDWIENFPKALQLLLKAIFQFVLLLLMMMRSSYLRPEFVLVQIPPAIPTLWICALFNFFTGIEIVLDWHNFAYTLMALNERIPHFLVEIAKWIESRCGRFAQRHFCVCQAMKAQLREWNIDAEVFYDQPHERFKPATITERHRLLKKLKTEFQRKMHVEDFCTRIHEELDEQSTYQTRISEMGEIVLRSDSRAALVVSSTSWTADEDFSVLLEAAKLYDIEWQQTVSEASAPKHPKLIILVTGKGPMKEFYLQKMQNLDFKSVAFRTAWLEVEDYPILLGSADLGVCLHTSSSGEFPLHLGTETCCTGVDLPMKVVDMFGCQLPVCTANYRAISELVKHGVNGLVFSTAHELYEAFWTLFQDFSCDQGQLLHRMRESLATERPQSWVETWNAIIWPILNARPK